MNNILICGVGGQGIVLTSKLIASASMDKGYSVMSAETIGMAQKGGGVTSFLRTSKTCEGEELYSPVYAKGTADIMIAFEPAEAVRNLCWLRNGGTMIVNTHAVMPVTAALTGGSYSSDEMMRYLCSLQESRRIRLYAFDCDRLAREAGSAKVLNMLMLSAAVKSGSIEGLTIDDIIETVKKTVKPQFVEMNLKAFAMDISFSYEPRKGE